MTGICLVVAGKATLVAAGALTLSWTHSVEKTRWEEDWRLADGMLVLVEARVEGSGAGMDPPQVAVLADGTWSWRPSLPPQQSLTLAASGAAPSAWTICADGTCRDIGATPSEPLTLRACRADEAGPRDDSPG